MVTRNTTMSLCFLFIYGSVFRSCDSVSFPASGHQWTQQEPQRPYFSLLQGELPMSYTDLRGTTPSAVDFKRSTDDGSWPWNSSPDRLSSFRDIRYRYVGLGKRSEDSSDYQTQSIKRRLDRASFTFDLGRTPVDKQLGDGRDYHGVPLVGGDVKQPRDGFGKRSKVDEVAGLGISGPGDLDDEDLNKRRVDLAHFRVGLGKRKLDSNTMIFGLGKKRAEDAELGEALHQSQTKNDNLEFDERKLDLSHFGFGLGKRGFGSNGFRFGLGKRIDRNGFRFGLGKRIDRNGFRFGLGKRSIDRNSFIFGLGKRKMDHSNFSFELDKKRLDRNHFKFGLGKRSLETKRKMDHSSFRFGLGKRKMDHNSFRFGLGKRKMDQNSFRFGLGKRKMDQNSFRFGLGKRKMDQNSFRFGLGKRKMDQNSFRFGLGKRKMDQNSFRFGLGKRKMDQNSFRFGLGKRKMDQNSFRFGLGKRTIDGNSFAFGLGKRLNKNNFMFGLGKRRIDRNNFKFGLGKRLDRNRFNFGLGKRRMDQNGFRFGLGKRAMDRNGFQFGLGKRETTVNDLPLESDEQKKDYDMSRLGKRRLDRNTFKFGLGKRTNNLNVPSRAEDKKVLDSAVLPSDRKGAILEPSLTGPASNFNSKLNFSKTEAKPQTTLEVISDTPRFFEGRDQGLTAKTTAVKDSSTSAVISDGRGLKKRLSRSPGRSTSRFSAWRRRSASYLDPKLLWFGLGKRSDQ